MLIVLVVIQGTTVVYEYPVDYHTDTECMSKAKENFSKFQDEPDIGYHEQRCIQNKQMRI